MEHELKNIKRMVVAWKSGKGKRSGYQVWVSAKGERINRFFNDEDYGGEAGSLIAAQEFRDSIFKKYNLSSKGRGSSSGIPGVSRTESKRVKDGKESVEVYWQAVWQSEPGKQVTKRFSVVTHGEEKAKGLAVKAREHAVDAISRGRDPIFEPPSSKNAKLWRYMDFTKFISMLDNVGIFFAQVDILGDPFEGSYSRGNEKQRNFVYSRRKEERNITELISSIRERRKNIMVSCWHHSNHESAAMWKLYAKTNEAICIQTTYHRLNRVVGDEANIGLVKYIDYERAWILENSVFYPFIYKRKSFEHEREIRAIVDLTERPRPTLFGRTETGLWLPVDLNYLIQKVYVSPESPVWFYELTKNICSKYGIRSEVVRSPLDGSPLY